MTDRILYAAIAPRLFEDVDGTVLPKECSVGFLPVVDDVAVLKNQYPDAAIIKIAIMEDGYSAE